MTNLSAERKMTKIIAMMAIVAMVTNWPKRRGKVWGSGGNGELNALTYTTENQLRMSTFERAFYFALVNETLPEHLSFETV
jgi:hypothetical protein